MGGIQGPSDDGYDEDGYDESQRAEILEATRDGPSDGAILTDLLPDLGDDPDEDARIARLGGVGAVGGRSDRPHIPLQARQRFGTGCAGAEGRRGEAQAGRTFLLCALGRVAIGGVAGEGTPDRGVDRRPSQCRFAADLP